MTPKEIFVLQEPTSNRALIRQPGEKWPDDVNTEPGPNWKHFIEKSAYNIIKAQLQTELDNSNKNAYDVSVVYSHTLHELACLRTAFEYLINTLPEECTAGFVTHARAIANGDPERIKATK